MAIETGIVVRLLTASSLAGLLFGVGLRLRGAEVTAAFRRSHLAWILPANFVLVPLLVLGLTRVAHLPGYLAVGMILLAAAPFAPVVPVFARMARADLALAAGLTALFPLLSSVLTPVVCALSLRAVAGGEGLRFRPFLILAVLLSTITLPLVTGVVVNHFWPKLGHRLLRPIEILSEATGAISLAFVTAVEFPAIRQTPWPALLIMTLAGEISLWIGYALGGPGVAARRVTALGASNRNIALAILVALDSFPGTKIVAAVVANGLLLIFLGLLHVGYWRFFARPEPLPH